MTTEANNPALWDAILARVRKVFGRDAVIAGGCVRDHLLELEPKDIDIFVNIESVEQLQERMPILNDMDFDLHEFEPREDEDYYNPDGPVKGVIEGAFYFGGHEWAVQIIASPEPCFCGEKLVQRFDQGIVRCWYDGELHDTEEARRDRLNKTVTILTNTTPSRSAERAARFIERHDYQFRKVNYAIAA